MLTFTKNSSAQLFVLVLLRIIIGWHLLYEGLTKLFNPIWSSVDYLNDSQGLFAPIFKALSSSPAVLEIIDIINVWLLIVVGLCLILGLFSRSAAMGGAVLLLLYYLCQPPFIGLEYSMPSEGNYLIINKVLIEMIALLVLFFFPTGKSAGLDFFLTRKKSKE
jgi:thiosulfate dehydrogenase [quinone] large subunit